MATEGHPGVGLIAVPAVLAGGAMPMSFCDFFASCASHPTLTYMVGRPFEPKILLGILTWSGDPSICISHGSHAHLYLHVSALLHRHAVPRHIFF